MDEKKREDKEFIDGAAVDSSETENGSVTADDLLGKLNSNIGGSKRKSRRERKKKKALEQTRDTTSDFYDLSINDVPDDFDTDAIIRDVMGESEYAKYVAGEGKDSDSDDYDEFVTQFSENVDGRSDSSDAAPAAAASEQPTAAAEPADGDAASDAAGIAANVGCCRTADVGARACGFSGTGVCWRQCLSVLRIYSHGNELDIEMPEKFETASPAFCFMKNDGFRKVPARNCRSKTPAWQWQSAQNRRFFWNIHFFRNMPSAALDAAGARMLQRQKRKC